MIILHGNTLSTNNYSVHKIFIAFLNVYRYNKRYQLIMIVFIDDLKVLFQSQIPISDVPK